MLWPKLVYVRKLWGVDFVRWLEARNLRNERPDISAV
jgi:hypothetical protein